MKSLYLLLTLLLIQSTCFSQKSYSLEDNFVIYNFPTTSVERWEKSPKTTLIFFVSNINDKLKIKGITHFEEDSIYNLIDNTLTTSDGKLIGKLKDRKNQVLVFQPNDSNIAQTTIKKGIIIRLFRFQNEIYFIEINGQKSKIESKLYKLQYVNSKFTYKEVLSINDLIFKSTICNNRLFLLGLNSFYEIKGSKEIRLLEKQLQGLILSSITSFENGIIYIGSSQNGIISYNIQDEKAIFYTLKDESAFDNSFYMQKDSFLELTKPNEKSDLSNFLNERIDPYYFQKLGWDTGTPVKVEFEISDKLKPTNIKIINGGRNFNAAIKKEFIDYPIEKLGIQSEEKPCLCTIQIGNSNINKFNASTVAVCDQLPLIINKPDSIDSYSKYAQYFNNNLQSFILKNISLEELEKSGLKGQITVNIEFIVNWDGKISNVNTKEIHLEKEEIENPTLKKEIERVIKSFEQIIIQPAYRNGKPFNYKHKYLFELFIEDK